MEIEHNIHAGGEKSNTAVACNKMQFQGTAFDFEELDKIIIL